LINDVEAEDTPFVEVGVESISIEKTLLRSIQIEDGVQSRKEREVTIRVPEGVGTDLKVRVNLSNMPEELLVPEDSKVGEVVTCDLPTVAPLGPLQQKRILYEDILMTRLRWMQLEDGSWVTDEFRKQKKYEAYRMLRGRRMGLVLVAIPEA